MKKKIKKIRPFFTIITPVKNRKKDLKKTLLSLKNQKFKDYEHIVIDAKSNDGTTHLFKKIKNEKTFFFSSNDRGIYDGLNKGLKKAKGSVVGVLNAGDTYTRSALKIVHKYFKKNNIEFLFGTVKKDRLKYGFYPKKLFWSFNFYPAHSSGFFIKLKSQKKIGYYNLKYKCSSDYDLFYKMINKYKMKGMATKKNELIGKFQLGGFSQQITMLQHIIEETRIRYDNNQNKILVFGIFFLRIIKNFYKLNLKKFLKNEI